jgi:putative transposase
MPRVFAKRWNQPIPWPAAYAIWASLKTLRAGNKWPAVLARAASVTPGKAPARASPCGGAV